MDPEDAEITSQRGIFIGRSIGDSTRFTPPQRLTRIDPCSMIRVVLTRRSSRAGDGVGLLTEWKGTCLESASECGHFTKGY